MDRLSLVLASSEYNGIDWVEVDCDDQTVVIVHFLNNVALAGTLAGAEDTTPGTGYSSAVTITGGGPVPAVPVMRVTGSDWSTDMDGRPLLTLTTPYGGDFSQYQLGIASSALDPYYAVARFSFKADCPSQLDCAPPGPNCPGPGGVMPPIDYLAKDFNSFRKALSDYSAWAYPGWVERDEPDVGMVLLEAMAAVADELSYVQDRFAAEATFATCTERRSLVRHARLVDYEPAPATSAQVLLQVDVASGPLPAGAPFLAPLPDGTTLTFEVGEGLADPLTGAVSTAGATVDPRWNAYDHTTGAPRIVPYIWDDSQTCLSAGATEMWVVGHGFGFTTGDPDNDVPGMALLIDTAAPSSLDPPVREVVHLSLAAEETDPLTHTDVTHLAWPASEALAYDHDQTRAQLAGNLVPASEGRRYTEQFAIAPPLPDLDGSGGGTGLANAPGAPVNAVARPGPNATCGGTAPVFYHTFAQGRLAWLLPQADVALQGQPLPVNQVPGQVSALPEVVLTQLPAASGDEPVTWQWWRSLLEAPMFADQPGYTVDPVSFTDARPPSERWSGPARWEYDGRGGDSVRFGDGVFGDRPDDGDIFQVTYRTTSGTAGNVAPGAISGVAPALGGIVLSVTNPFAATGGSDEEPDELVRRRAPYAFQAVQYRAVTAPDYVRAAESLPAVLDAGTQFRWTGSWLTVFTTAEPAAGGVGADLAVSDKISLVELLDREKLAGYESYVDDPQYVGLDLVVTVCVEGWAFAAEVEAAVLTELGTSLNAAGQPAFFSQDRWSFGQPLERSALEAAAQQAVGIEGVVTVQYRRRGVTNGFVTMPQVVTVGANQVICVACNPGYPDWGSLNVVTQGGK